MQRTFEIDMNFI